MDKLKIIKSMVFLLTFGIVFLLCLVVFRTVSEPNEKSFSVNLGEPISSQINHIFAQGNRLYIVTDEQKVLVVNMRDKKQEGVIFLTRGDQ